MKRIYIKPHTSLVQINLIGSVLEDLGVNGGSNQGKLRRCPLEAAQWLLRL